MAERKEWILSIEGMTCHHCEMTVDKAISAVPGVVESHASHEAGEARVVVEGDVDEKALADAVEGRGYHVTGQAAPASSAG